MRLEIKLGTVAVADDFDKNRYANSTRTQFENWSLFNNTAYDYAADTRGCTGGLMVGYISPVWSLRYGVYQVPKFANGQPPDNPITKANGRQLELRRWPRLCPRRRSYQLWCGAGSGPADVIGFRIHLEY